MDIVCDSCESRFRIADETRCHRSVLRALLLEAGADLAA